MNAAPWRRTVAALAEALRGGGRGLSLLITIAWCLLAVRLLAGALG